MILCLFDFVFIKCFCFKFDVGVSGKGIDGGVG